MSDEDKNDFGNEKADEDKSETKDDKDDSLGGEYFMDQHSPSGSPRDKRQRVEEEIPVAGFTSTSAARSPPSPRNLLVAG